jgi:hypothetical protein
MGLLYELIVDTEAGTTTVQIEANSKEEALENEQELPRLPPGLGKPRTGGAERLSLTKCAHQKPPSSARGSWINHEQSNGLWSLKLLALAPGAERSRCGVVGSPGAPEAVQTECRSVRRTR